MKAAQVEDEAAESSAGQAGSEATPDSMMMHNEAGGGRSDSRCKWTSSRSNALRFLDYIQPNDHEYQQQSFDVMLHYAQTQTHTHTHIQENWIWTYSSILSTLKNTFGNILFFLTVKKSHEKTKNNNTAQAHWFLVEMCMFKKGSSIHTS